MKPSTHLSLNGIISGMPSIIALDIETTGLDPNSDAITEIGIVRFSGHRVEAEWTSLVNPGRPIPPAITQLTGISNEMVRNAPPMKALVHEIVDFIGTAPIVGQNIMFDLSFLQRHGVLPYNDILDTYDMASVLLPTASRYNLGALALNLGIPLLEDAHRALADARVTHSVFVRLFEKALELPIDVVAEFVRLSEPFDWGGSWIFKQALKVHGRQNVTPHANIENGFSLFKPVDSRLFPPLEANDNVQGLNSDEVASVLEYGGPFSKYFKGYEQRPQQVEMLRSITDAFSNGQHLLVEAGTGTGKSFAYLVPAALFAIQNQTRVVISTNTINLQDQLVNKDLPDLCQALDLDLRFTVLKGRANYLCPRRFETFRQRGPEGPEEMRVLGKVMIWLLEGGSGDRTEINLNGPIERDIWSRLSAEDDACKAEVCLSRTGGCCPFFRARQAAQSAHLLIVNHALLLSDVATGSRVLPDYDYLVIDEGHHLESATTSALSFRATQGDLARILRELGSVSSGSLGHILTQLQGVLRPSDLAAFHQTFQRATDLAFRLEHDLKEFFKSLEYFLQEQREGRPVGAYGHQERILSATRTQPAWGEVEMAWDSADETFKLLINLIAEIHKSASNLDGEVPEELDDYLGSLSNLYRRMTECETNICAMVSNPAVENIYWVEIPPNNGSLAIQVAPLHIGPLMDHYLWREKASIILTSATLTTNGGDFDYLRERLNANDANELALGSPFDYENSALLYLVNDIPEPNDATNYQRAVEQTLIRLSKASGGKLLALFTSYAQLKRTSQVITPALAEAGIQVYEQGEGASANTLLETFREADKAILLGTKAFWEGVDIPGAALSILVIVKLPFDVPTDPIVAARSETFDDPFNEYNLPEAILRFRQGFGRLIRTQSDRGVVVILDRRILTKRYGKTFIQSLPACTVRPASMHDLPAAAVRWLNR
jgi:DNA polymerase-3 subunit epsilon/ATP-dependent DNA helicase DinG